MKIRVLWFVAEWAVRAVAKAVARKRADAAGRAAAEAGADADARRRLQALKDELSR